MCVHSRDTGTSDALPHVLSGVNIGLFCRALLQKRPMILRSLLIVANIDTGTIDVLFHVLSGVNIYLYVYTYMYICVCV